MNQQQNLSHPNNSRTLHRNRRTTTMHPRNASRLLLRGSLLTLPLVAAEIEPLPQAEYNQSVNTIHRTHNARPLQAFAAYTNFYATAAARLTPNMRIDLLRRTLYQGLSAGEPGHEPYLQLLLDDEAEHLKPAAIRSLLLDLSKRDRHGDEAARQLYLNARITALLPPVEQINIEAALGANAIRYLDDFGDFSACTDALEKIVARATAGSDERETALLQQRIGDAIVSVLTALMPYTPEVVAKLATTHDKLLSDGQRANLMREQVLAAIAKRSRSDFETALANFEKLADDASRYPNYTPIARAINRDDPGTARQLLQRALQTPSYNAAQRYALAWDLALLQRPGAFQYGFFDEGSYERFKADALAALAILQEALADESLKPDRRIAGHYHDIALTAADFGDYPWAYEMLALARENYPHDNHFMPLAVRLAIHTDTLEAVTELLEPLIAHYENNDTQRHLLKAILHLYRQQSFDGFDDFVFAGSEIEAAERMVVIRCASELLFRGGRYDLSRLAHSEVVDKMFTPVVAKRYQVRWEPDCPKTADAWARSPHYQNWEQMEQRFVPYGDGYDMNNDTDAKRHLKTATPPTVPADYRTGVDFVCDERGLHIFVRCDTPEIAAIRDGQTKGDGLELLFRPGTNAAYHSWYFAALPYDVTDKHRVEWASPSPRYRLTADHFLKDGAITAEALIGHTLIPWIAFHDNLPLDGHTWRFGLQRWGKHSATLNGSVHELARALELDFTLPPAAAAAIQRAVATAAFQRYKQIRDNKGDFILQWQDKLLGDPDFYAAEVAPLIESLDAAGVRLMAPAAEDEIAALYREFVPQWAEINHLIANRRDAWNRRALLSDP